MKHALSIRVIDDCRARRVAELLTVLCVLSVADLIFTIWAQLFTAFYEVNPLARELIQHNNLLSLVAMKLALTGIGAGIFWRLRKHGRAELALWAVVLVYVLLTIRWNNYTTEALAIVNSQA